MIKMLNCKKAIFNAAIRLLCLSVIMMLLMPFSIASMSSAVDDKSELTKLISDNEDPQMSVKDLAFLLVTHNFDAAPKKDFVEVRLGRTVYKLVPNGAHPGLANITLVS